MPIGRTARTTLQAIATALALTGLWACMPPAEVAVYNNTGETILLRINPVHFWHLDDKVVEPDKVDSGYVEEMLPPGLVVETRTCIFGYDLPPIDKAYEYPDGHYQRYHSVQIEPDFSAVLIPSQAAWKIVPDARRLPLQRQYGYPVRPAFKKCAGTRRPWLFEAKNN